MYILKESFLQAFDQLRANKLRSFLSLLGIMVGIFCVIAVKSAVNSLEDNVRHSFDKLGSDVIYVSKFSWAEDPEANFWKFAHRPNPNINDFKTLTNTLHTADIVSYSIFLGVKTLKYERNSVSGVFCVAVTDNYDKLRNLEYETGRFFTPTEYALGMNRVLIGAKVAEQLFGDSDPVGRDIEIYGRKMQVVGVLKKLGRDLLQIFNTDNALLMPFETARAVTNVKTNNPFSGNVMVKALPGVTETQLRDDVTINLRKAHFLKPQEKDNFSLNSSTVFADGLAKLFTALNIVGYIIGGFALLVGMFSVANIMFVSVKERTSIIGIKKALGAKQWVILLEFLIESIVLCILGGIMGLALVFGLMKLLSLFTPFDLYVSTSNALATVLLSIVIGIISGVIPALQASRMDPVEAIRS